jgi:tripartite-type tricarboxylate transporter receptor subunit TctC
LIERAIGGLTRSANVPGSGYRIRGEGWHGIYAPAKTAPEVIARLNAAIVSAVRTPQIKDRMMALHLVPTGTSGPELARIQKADSDLWVPVTKASGFKPD